jgi:predicted DCC family thiol-disulfide oxidoreductase YuxK
MTGMPRDHVLLYDRDCGFCKWSLDKILAWDRGGRLRPVPIQGEEGERLLAAVDRETRLDSWHLVTPARQVLSAGAAAEPLARLLPGGRPLAFVFRSFPGIMQARVSAGQIPIQGLSSRCRSGLVKQPGFLGSSETRRCLGSEPFFARSDHNAFGVTRRFTFRRTGCRRSAAYTRRALFPSPARECCSARLQPFARSTPQTTLLTPSGGPLPR